jgi:hypothetical protein
MSGGLILEILGYGGRLGMNDDPFKFTWFILWVHPFSSSRRQFTDKSRSLVSLTIAPAFLAASIYLCLGRLVQGYGENISRFSSRFYTFTFITCDFISLLLQAVGGALAATEDKTNPTNVGVNVMIAGLAFQVASLALFMFLSLEFVYRAVQARQADLNFEFFKLGQRKMFRLLPYALALATVTIFIRCAFRVAELQDGFSGNLANDEPMFMGFEGPMIIVAVAAMTLVHPGIAFSTAANWQAASFPWKQSRKAKSATEPEAKHPSMIRASSDDTVVGEDEPKEQI